MIVSGWDGDLFRVLECEEAVDHEKSTSLVPKLDLPGIKLQTILSNHYSEGKEW